MKDWKWSIGKDMKRLKKTRKESNEKERMEERKEETVSEMQKVEGEK